MEQPAVGPPVLPTPARALTRGLCLFVLLLVVAAIVYAAWIALDYAGQIGV